MKKIISMLLIITSLFALCTINVSAAREEEFLSEVALVYEDSVENAKAAIAGTDWKLFEQDLNPNADYMFDDGVYLVYKTSTNVEDAITDLRVMDMYGGYSSANYERQLEASRESYKNLVDELRIVANEFRQAYIGGDPMAALANRQLNFYKDVKTEGGTETDMRMGNFFMDMPSDDQVVQVLFEGNAIVVSNLITLLAVGISGSDETTLADRIAEKYAIKDTLSDERYYDDAVILHGAFESIRAKLLRYEALSDEYDFTDEDMTEEEFVFMSEYASTVAVLHKINFIKDIEGYSLASFLHEGKYTVKDFYPIAAALTEGQMAIVKMGQLETILKFGAPSASAEELNAHLYDYINEINKEYDGILDKGIDVYVGVDRSIFKGSFAMTNAAERYQALSGETWDMEKTAEDSKIPYIISCAIGSLGALSAGTAIGIGAIALFYKSVIWITKVTKMTYGVTAALWKMSYSSFANWALPAAKLTFIPAALAIMLVAGGIAGIATWYNYYNPDYTEIPNTLVDVRETDLGDKYVKYTAAKVYDDGELSEKNADFNAYEGKEWNALYYTKDAMAGSCLTPKFVYSDNSSTIARRHQGISMFGETEAFNLNSHVYNDNAPGVFVTIRYSTTEKAAADMPSVVGSMFATGALYTVTLLGGAGLGVGGTLLVQKAKKKKDEPTPENTEDI